MGSDTEAENCVRSVLLCIGEDVQRDGLVDTPKVRPAEQSAARTVLRPSQTHC